MRYTVHPLESSDLDAAASLVADRHTKNRFRLPDLSPSFSDPAHCRAALITALEDSRSTSAAAIADGRLAGFAIGATSVSQSDSLLGQIGAARSATVNAHTMGLAEGEAATSVFRSIYRDLSGGWIANGFFDHNVHVIAGDREIEAAWFNLGFGKTTSVALRPTASADWPKTDVSVLTAGEEDVDVVIGLQRALGHHHMDAPMFLHWPLLGDADSAAREFLIPLLQDPGSPHFIAYRDGRALGMTSFMSRGLTPPVINQEKNVYLFMGIVEPESQADGVGGALLDHGLAWAREQGYERCTLHVLTANYSGAPFWFGHGFVSHEEALARHIDERLVWARPDRP